MLADLARRNEQVGGRAKAAARAPDHVQSDGAGGAEHRVVLRQSLLEQGRTLEQIDKQVNQELLTIFKPELVNRFDEVVLFKPLSPEDLQKIVTIKLAGLQAQMKDKGYLVEFDEALVGEFAKRGFDPVLGARPMRRLMQDTLEAKLSKLILQNELVKGKPFKAGVELLAE